MKGKVIAVVTLAERRKAKERARFHTKMLVDRIKGVPAQEGTPETEADPRNPNVRPTNDKL